MTLGSAIGKYGFAATPSSILAADGVGTLSHLTREQNPNAWNRKKMCVRLRDIDRHDLKSLYEFQLDPEANQLAATNPRSLDSFNKHWEASLEDTSVIAQAILLDDELVGCISCFKSDGLDSIGYWIEKKFWGQGVATQALKLLLTEIPIRPLHARVAVTNVASLRVLQKCSFVIVGYQHAPGDDRYQECEEAILKLDRNPQT